MSDGKYSLDQVMSVLGYGLNKSTDLYEQIGLSRIPVGTKLISREVIEDILGATSSNPIGVVRTFD
ncbi:MAG: hypothetical protein UY48_C0003G0015 [Candidatus Gottesmanbacteria bacterium GW2011_GWB1_49_7]|uniref:Uncharacterized protein n=1 Tax=Candidatus Gottesmanbacteria bacterium GW2011_GWB1_49_7 TaxID=1618448 RepID=A0A0G1W3C4_9BACT|nr:MAG: hypothetical protein UY48_C0003G0015 [Candidatus Gottesmanbacteria bacterium GW2011_GWB1_49_7]